MVFRVPETILRAYGVTLFVTIFGTALALFLTAMTAYVLSRHACKYRNKLAFFFYFASLFSGGMIPTYILISQYLHLKDNIFVLILPILLSAWNIFLMRNFMQEIPEEISEAATIDGANQFQIFFKMYLPLAKPGLATVGLFIALMYWNDWYHAMLYINNFDAFVDELLQEESLADALQSIQSYLNSIMDTLEEQQKLKYEALTQRIKEFIKQHYSEEFFSINNVFTVYIFPL